MFVQVFQGQVLDEVQIRGALDRWVEEVSPGATGWLGSTAGVTEDGRFIALARFDTEEHARRNSDRPEQDAWWSVTSKLFTGPVTFQDSVDVLADIVGDPGSAGFVQVMQGRGSDPARVREIMEEDPAAWAEFRPDILASVAVNHVEGAYTMAIYFTSLEAAREGETKEPPETLLAAMEEMNSLSIGEPTFFDLKQPWLASA